MRAGLEAAGAGARWRGGWVQSGPVRVLPGLVGTRAGRELRTVDTGVGAAIQAAVGAAIRLTVGQSGTTSTGRA